MNNPIKEYNKKKRELKKVLLKREIDVNVEVLENTDIYLLDEDYDECIVGVSTSGAVIYEYGEVVFVYSQINEDEHRKFASVDDFFVDIEEKILSLIEDLSDEELKGRKRPLMIALNNTNYEIKYSNDE